MKARTIGLALALTLGPGCHSAPAPEPSVRWQHVGDSAEPLEAAREKCRTEALEKTKEITAQGLATKAAGGIFVECMRQRGWVQVSSDVP